MNTVETNQLTKHTSATINRFLRKVNEYEPGLVKMIFNMIFVPCKGGEHNNNPFVRYVYDRKRAIKYNSMFKFRYHGRQDFKWLQEVHKKSIKDALIISISNKNCHIPEHFAYCSHKMLTNVNNSDYILGLHRFAFRCCKELKSFTFNKKIKVLACGVFSECIKIKKLPPRLKAIGEYCFWKCRNIKRLTLPNTLKKIFKAAFYDSGLEYISIPHSVDTLKVCAFEKCKELKKVRLYCRITKLECMTFADCISLTDIKLPYGLKSIGFECFYGCLSLKSIQLPNTLESISDKGFAYCIGLNDIKLPYGLKSIGYECFYGCLSLKSIQLPNTLKSISTKAFFRSGLESIKIPFSVTILEKDAFRYCKNLKTASLPIHLKPIIDASSPRNFTSIFNKKVKITYRYPYKIKEKSS